MVVVFYKPVPDTVVVLVYRAVVNSGCGILQTSPRHCGCVGLHSSGKQWLRYFTNRY